MSFAAPAILYWLGLAAVVPLLYLVRRRSRRAPVPHLFLWERAIAAQGRSRRSRIHDILGLLLNTAIVAALVLAAAGPRRSIEKALPRPTLLVLDSSLSMSARDARGRDRASRARALIADRLEALVSEGPVGLALVAEGVSLPAPLGSGIETLRALLAQDQVCRGRFEPTVLVDFIAAARERTPGLRVLLCSDLAFDDDEGALRAAGIELLPIAASARNAALVACRLVERESARFRVEVEVAVTGGPLAGRILMRLPRGEGGAVAFDLAAGARETFELEGEQEGEVFVEVALEVEDDALAADDRLEFKLDRDPRLRLLVVAEEVGVHLEAALAALDEVFDPAAAAKVKPADWRRADLGRFDLVLLRGVDERQALPEGRYILIDSFAPGLPFQRLGSVERPAVLRQEETGGLLRGLDLRDLEVVRAQRLRAVEPVDVLLDSDAGPLVAQAPGLVQIAFDSSEEASSLVLLPAFPLLLKDAARSLAPRRARLLPPVAPAGRAADLADLPPRGRPLVEIDESRSDLGPDLLLPGGRFLAPARLGRARLVCGERREDLGLAVLDARSSRLAAGAIAGADDPGPPLRRRSEEPLGLLVLGLALGLVLLEWLLYSRGFSR